jgi:hypothetical protein
VVAKQHQAKASLRPSQKAVVERSPVSLQVLQAQLTNSPLKAGSSQTAKQPQTGEAPCGQPGAQQEAVSKAWGKRRPTATTPHPLGHGGRLQQAQQALVAVVQRAAHKGFGKVPSTNRHSNQPATAYTAESAEKAGFLR